MGGAPGGGVGRAASQQRSRATPECTAGRAAAFRVLLCGLVLSNPTRYEPDAQAREHNTFDFSLAGASGSYRNLALAGASGSQVHLALGCAEQGAPRRFV